jgi:hypothetical protein
MNKFSTWYGVSINELNREKLIEVIEWCGREIQRLKQDRDRWFAAGDLLKYLDRGETHDNN